MNTLGPEHRHLVTRDIKRWLDHLQRPPASPTSRDGSIATMSVLSTTDRTNRKCGTESTTRRVMPTAESTWSVAP